MRQPQSFHEADTRPDHPAMQLNSPGSDSEPAPPAPSSPPTADEQLLAAIVARGENAGGEKRSGGGMLLLTGALFLGAGGWSWGWSAVVMLAAAIAIHELGHVIAMRLFGYKNVRMLFVPFFGGLATGQPSELDATRNALVALAGPVIGLFSALLVAVAGVFLGRPEWIAEFAWISVGLNAFNLLPLVPLDGGQVANDTLFSRYPVLETAFRAIAVAGLGWFAWDLQSWILAVVPFFLLVSASHAHRRACVVRDARRDPVWQNRVLDVETAGLLRTLVARMFPQFKPQVYERALPDHAHSLWMEIRKHFPGPGRTVALLAGYVVVGARMFPAIAGLVAHLYGRP